MAIGEFYDCTWGSVRLWCASVSTDNSRTKVIHELAEGDEHPVQDRGLGVRKVTCELLFVQMPREPRPPRERFLEFKAQVDGGEDHLFQHPLGETYYAGVEAFTHEIDEDGNLTASVTFVKSGEPEAPVQTGAGTTAAAGEDAVATQAAALTAELDEVGISSTTPADAVAAQASWSESETVPTRQVIVDVARLSDSLATMIEDEGLERDLKLFPAYKASILLGNAIRAAALAALAETPRLTAVRIKHTISLLALCVRIYGGAEAEDRVRQILALNDIRTAGWLEADTVIMIPIPSRAQRARALARAA